MTAMIQNFTTAILCVCAVIITGFVIRDQRKAAVPTEAPPVVFGWEEMLGEGSRVGPTTAPIEILAFSDYQCSACNRAHLALEALRTEFPHRFAIVYRHFPLEETHPHALEAAVAAECAAEQGQFKSYHDLLFRHQESIGSTPWGKLAEESGINDVPAFVSCLSQDRARSRVERDLALAGMLDLRAVPRFIIEGRILTGDQALRHLTARLRGLRP